MSIRSITDLAVKRDAAATDRPVASTDPGRSDERRTDALISAIPAEVLALYTAVTGGVLAKSILDSPGSYLPFRWTLLGCALGLTPIAVLIIYRRKFKAALEAKRPAEGDAAAPRTRWPWLEMVSSTLAAAAWFLAAPGSPLLAQLSTNVAEMTSTTIVVGTLALLWAGFGRPLTLGSAAGPFQPAEAAAPAAGVPPVPVAQPPVAQAPPAGQPDGARVG